MSEKVASRFLLPLEIFQALHLIALGITGGLAHGALFRALERTQSNQAWLILFVSAGLPLLFTGLYEWFFLRHANRQMVFKSVGARAGLSLYGGVLWVCALIIIAAEGAARSTMLLVTIAPISIFFHAWCFRENLKVRYALDPNRSTSKLVFHR